MGVTYQGPSSSGSVFQGAEILDNIVTAQLTASVDNFDPAGGQNTSIIYLFATTAVNITGLTGAAKNRRLILEVLAGSATITLKNASGSSLAANQFNLTADLPIAANQNVALLGLPGSLGWSAQGSAAIAAENAGRLVGFQVVTTTGAYTPTPGTNSFIAIPIGAGGGSGGITGVAANFGSTGGGQSGGYLSKRVTTILAPYAITIGAAGVAGVAGGAGGNGGDTILVDNLAATVCTAAGGAGSPAAVVGVTPSLNAGGSGGGTVSGGDFGVVGMVGGIGGTQGVAGTTYSGAGGSNPYGTGGDPRVGGGAGIAATGFGAGAGGAAATNATSRAGGAGAPGAMLIWEYS